MKIEADRQPIMDAWNTAKDDLTAIESEEVATSVDQRLKIVEIKALLAIGEQLSRIQGGAVAEVR
jgi:hypothetical protein